LLDGTLPKAKELPLILSEAKAEDFIFS